MDRSIPLLLIGIVFGTGVGFTVAASNGITLDGHDHTDPSHHGAQHGEMNAAAASDGHPAGHGHQTALVLPEGDKAPTLAVDVMRDPASGWNLHMNTNNFVFSPQNASLAPVEGEGHAHIYVNGVKLGRFYAPWVHLDNLPTGEVSVMVTLNANDHRPLQVGDNRIEQTVKIAN